MDFRNLLSSSGLNTLTFSDPVAKVMCTSAAAIQLGRTLYFDLDTMFAAYASAGLFEPRAALKADILLPSKGRFMPMLQTAFDLASSEKYSLVVFDSLNGIYNMYDISSDGAGRANQFLCTVVMMLVRLGLDSGTPVLVTSMLRFRKERGWIQSPAARRLINHNSVAVLNAKRVTSSADTASEHAVDKAQVTVEMHPSVPAGTQYQIDDVSIILR